MMTRDIKIDDLIREHFDAVGFLIQHGLPCVVCGEPFWGTLEDLARQKNWSDEQIDALVTEFNESHQ